MSKSVLAVAGILCFANMAFAQSSASSTTNTAAVPGAASCEGKAVGKNGKPLAGAAKNTFMKKCEASAKVMIRQPRALRKQSIRTVSH